MGEVECGMSECKGVGRWKIRVSVPLAVVPPRPPMEIDIKICDEHYQQVKDPNPALLDRLQRMTVRKIPDSETRVWIDGKEIDSVESVALEAGEHTMQVVHTPEIKPNRAMRRAARRTR